jgi:hypothetical protein
VTVSGWVLTRSLFLTVVVLRLLQPIWAVTVGATDEDAVVGGRSCIDTILAVRNHVVA